VKLVEHDAVPTVTVTTADYLGHPPRSSWPPTPISCPLITTELVRWCRRRSIATPRVTTVSRRPAAR